MIQMCVQWPLPFDHVTLNLMKGNEAENEGEDGVKGQEWGRSQLWLPSERALENHISCKSEQALMWNSHVDVCPALTFALHEHL